MNRVCLQRRGSGNLRLIAYEDLLLIVLDIAYYSLLMRACSLVINNLCLKPKVPGLSPVTSYVQGELFAVIACWCLSPCCSGIKGFNITGRLLVFKLQYFLMCSWNIKFLSSGKPISLVIRQKSESQNASNKKTKLAKFFQKRTFSTPCVRIRDSKCFFLEKLVCFFFLLPPFWDLPCCLITDDIF